MFCALTCSPPALAEGLDGTLRAMSLEGARQREDFGTRGAGGGPFFWLGVGSTFKRERANRRFVSMCLGALFGYPFFLSHGLMTPLWLLGFKGNPKACGCEDGSSRFGLIFSKVHVSTGMCESLAEHFPLCAQS